MMNVTMNLWHARRDLLNDVRSRLAPADAVGIELKHGRWHCVSAYGVAHDVSQLLEEAAQRRREDSWREGLSPKAAQSIYRMCMRLLEQNPHNIYVRHHYPALYQQLTA